MADHPLTLPATTIQKIDALFNEYQSSDDLVVALALISTDGVVIHGTFDDKEWLKKIAAMSTAAHEIGSRLYQACSKGTDVEWCYIITSSVETVSHLSTIQLVLATFPLEYGLLVVPMISAARLGGPFTIENLQLAASYIEALIRTGQEPPPIKWRWGF